MIAFRRQQLQQCRGTSDTVYSVESCTLLANNQNSVPLLTHEKGTFCDPVQVGGSDAERGSWQGQGLEVASLSYWISLAFEGGEHQEPAE